MFIIANTLACQPTSRKKCNFAFLFVGFVARIPKGAEIHTSVLVDVINAKFVHCL